MKNKVYLILACAIGLFFSINVFAKSVTISMEARDSKQLFLTQHKNFKVLVGKAELSCRSYMLPFADEWQAFSYCRNQDTHAFIFSPWKENGWSLKDVLSLEEFDIKKHSIYVTAGKIGVKKKKSNYLCNHFKKVELPEKETDEWKYFNASINCKSTNKKNTTLSGLIDFVEHPLESSSFVSYQNRLVFPVASNAKNFNDTLDKFFAKIPQGTYKGVMKTLSKKCEISFEEKSGEFTISHTSLGNRRRTRTLTFAPENLLGVLEGDLYKKVLAEGGDPVGTFAAAQFKIPGKKIGDNDIITIRFETRTDKDNLVIRLNSNSYSYCRRLVKK